MNLRSLVYTAFLVNVGLIYIGETGRNLSIGLRLKKYETNCEKAGLDKSAVAKHSWTYNHRIK